MILLLDYNDLIMLKVAQKPCLVIKLSAIVLLQGKKSSRLLSIRSLNYIHVFNIFYAIRSVYLR